MIPFCSVWEEFKGPPRPFVSGDPTGRFTLVQTWKTPYGFLCRAAERFRRSSIAWVKHCVGVWTDVQRFHYVTVQSFSFSTSYCMTRLNHVGRLSSSAQKGVGSLSSLNQRALPLVKQYLVTKIVPLSVTEFISSSEVACWIIWPSGNIARHIWVEVVHFRDALMTNSRCHAIFH